MRRVSQFGLGILLLAAASISAAEQPLGPGYFKWLLHLGQNPTDGFASQYPPAPKHLKPYMGGPFMPFPGQIYDFEEMSWLPTTSKTLIWTPQYSPSGVFAEDVGPVPFSLLYHIYIFSPEQRQARLWFKAPYYGLNAWNEGQKFLDTKGSGPGAEGHEALQHGGHQRVALPREQLAVGVGPGASLAEADVALRIEPPLAPERAHVVVPVRQGAAALEDRAGHAVVHEGQGREQPGRSRAHDDGPERTVGGDPGLPERRGRRGQPDRQCRLEIGLELWCHRQQSCFPLSHAVYGS